MSLVTLTVFLPARIRNPQDDKLDPYTWIVTVQLLGTIIIITKSQRIGRMVANPLSSPPQGLNLYRKFGSSFKMLQGGWLDLRFGFRQQSELVKVVHRLKDE